MAHSVKVSDETLAALRRLQLPRETYGDVVKRLVGLWDAVEYTQRSAAAAERERRTLLPGPGRPRPEE